MNDDFESKSARKREAHRLRALGLELAKLTSEQRAGLPLDADLERALAEYARITSHIARKRHVQRIGRLMRAADVAAIEAGIEHLRGESASARYAQHAIEQWRAALLAEDAALTEFMSHYGPVDAAQLRQLIRRARARPEDSGRARALFRHLREIVERHDQPVPPTVI